MTYRGSLKALRTTNARPRRLDDDDQNRYEILAGAVGDLPWVPLVTDHVLNEASQPSHVMNC